MDITLVTFKTFPLGKINYMGSYSEMNGDSGVPREYNPRYLGPRYYIKFPGVQRPKKEANNSIIRFTLRVY